MTDLMREKLSKSFSISMAFWKNRSCQTAGTEVQSSYRSAASEMHLLFLHSILCKTHWAIQWRDNYSVKSSREYAKCRFLEGKKIKVFSSLT